MSVYADPWDDPPADEEELSAAADAYEAQFGWDRTPPDVVDVKFPDPEEEG